MTEKKVYLIFYNNFPEMFFQLLLREIKIELYISVLIQCHKSFCGSFH